MVQATKQNETRKNNVEEGNRSNMQKIIDDELIVEVRRINSIQNRERFSYETITLGLDSNKTLQCMCSVETGN